MFESYLHHRDVSGQVHEIGFMKQQPRRLLHRNSAWYQRLKSAQQLTPATSFTRFQLLSLGQPSFQVPVKYLVHFFPHLDLRLWRVTFFLWHIAATSAWPLKWFSWLLKPRSSRDAPSEHSTFFVACQLQQLPGCCMWQRVCVTQVILESVSTSVEQFQACCAVSSELLLIRWRSETRLRTSHGGLWFPTFQEKTALSQTWSKSQRAKIERRLRIQGWGRTFPIPTENMTLGEYMRVELFGLDNELNPSDLHLDHGKVMAAVHVRSAHTYTPLAETHNPHKSTQRVIQTKQKQHRHCPTRKHAYLARSTLANCGGGCML